MGVVSREEDDVEIWVVYISPFFSYIFDILRVNKTMENSIKFIFSNS